MNPNTGDIHRGDLEFLKEIEKRDDVKLIPVTEGKATFVEAMEPEQRKALAKQERERLAQEKNEKLREAVAMSVGTYQQSMLEQCEEMGAIQREALAKQERKRLARLEQVRKSQLVSSS